MTKGEGDGQIIKEGRESQRKTEAKLRKRETDEGKETAGGRRRNISE